MCGKKSIKYIYVGDVTTHIGYFPILIKISKNSVRIVKIIKKFTRKINKKTNERRYYYERI